MRFVFLFLFWCLPCFAQQGLPEEADLVVKLASHGGRAQFSLIKDHTTLFEGPLRSCEGQGYSLTREQSGQYALRFLGTAGTFLHLTASVDGTLSLVQATGFETSSLGLRSFSKIINNAHSYFRKIFSYSQELHNYGFLKAGQAKLRYAYLFNRGIIHGGTLDTNLDLSPYDGHRRLIRSDARPRFQNHVIDDHGVIISDGKMNIGSATHKAHGIVEAGRVLIEQGGSIENKGTYCADSLTGRGSIRNSGAMHVGRVSSSNFTMDSFTNTGEVRVDGPSTLYAQARFDNQGVISGGSTLNVGCRKKPKRVGIVTANDAVKLIIKEMMQQTDMENSFKNSGVFSKNVNVTYDALQHTDHYLNTITHHYTVYPNGQRVYSHQTETGYQFQKRDTNKTTRTLQVQPPQELDNMVSSMQLRQGLLKAMREGLKKALQKLSESGGVDGDLLKALLGALKDSGLSLSDIGEVLNDPAIQMLLGGLKAAAILGENPFAIEHGPLLHGITQKVMDGSRGSQGLTFGKRMSNWIKANGTEVILEICDKGVQLALGRTLVGQGVKTAYNVARSLFQCQKVMRTVPKPQAQVTTNVSPNTIVEKGNTWTKTQFNERTIYKNNNNFDPLKIDTKNRTNIQRMKEGNAPIGIDGKPVELHHMTQQELNPFNGSRGPVAEVTSSFHNKNYNQIHIYERNHPEYSSWRNNNQTQVREFETFKRNYWKMRAGEF